MTRGFVGTIGFVVAILDLPGFLDSELSTCFCLELSYHKILCRRHFNKVTIAQIALVHNGM